jgi:hypothetical protein
MSQPKPLQDNSKGPVFIGGLERSGKTYLRMMLAAHPAFAFSRRIDLWGTYYNRYGDLNKAENLDRCLADIMRSKHVRALSPDIARVKREIGLAPVSYGRLFALIHEHFAMRIGKPRWGTHNIFLERFAREILETYPNARIIHMIRDPRDRFEAMLHKYHNRGGIGVATARWCVSAKLAQQNPHIYPEQYKVVRYEGMVSDPESTLREICDFLNEPFQPQMLRMEGEARFANIAGNAEDDPISPLTTDHINRFQRGLSAGDISYIQKYSEQLMSHFEYPLYPVQFSWPERLRFHLFDLPVDSLYLLGWRVLDGVKA